MAGHNGESVSEEREEKNDNCWDAHEDMLFCKGRAELREKYTTKALSRASKSLEAECWVASIVFDFLSVVGLGRVVCGIKNVTTMLMLCMCPLAVGATAGAKYQGKLRKSELNGSRESASLLGDDTPRAPGHAVVVETRRQLPRPRPVIMVQ